MALDASAGGAGISYGVANPVVKGDIPVSAGGLVQSVGTALASIAYPVGSMAEFSIFDNDVLKDPLKSRLVGFAQGNDVSTTWTRFWTSATAPKAWATGNGDGTVLWN